MTLSLPRLADEVEYARGLPAWADNPDLSFFLDRNAAIITDDLRVLGVQAAADRGSTWLGVGPTMAAKVARRIVNGQPECPTAGQFAYELKELGIDVGNAVAYLNSFDRATDYDEEKQVLIEASQGALLSLDHGHYPWCTSRNVTAVGAVSDTGLSARNIRRVIMVVKAVPTRVPGRSGPAAGKELTWEEVCKRAGRPYEEIYQTADLAGGGKGAGGLERPFELSMGELQYAAELNGPTSIALTFADWYDYSVFRARQTRHLSPKVMRLVKRVEEVTRTPVFMVRTGPGYGDMVFLRSGVS